MSRGGQPEGFLSIIPQLLSGVCGLKLSDGIRDGGTFWGLQLYYASCHISIKIAPMSRPARWPCNSDLHCSGSKLLVCYHWKIICTG